MRNSDHLGLLVREARGQRSQQAIALAGGPHRQKLAAIERGEPLELSQRTLAQLDAGLAWAPGTAEAILETGAVTARGADSTSWKHAGPAEGRLFGRDAATGEPVSLPQRLVVPEFEPLNPLIRSWPGQVVVDINALDHPRGYGGGASRPERLGLNTRALTEAWVASQRPVLTVGIRSGVLPYGIVDPVPDVDSLERAKELAALLLATRPTVPVSMMEMATTILLLAAQPASEMRKRRGLLTIEMLCLAEADPAWCELSPTWDELFPHGTLLMIFGESAGSLGAFAGLIHARDEMLNGVIDTEKPGRVRWEVPQVYTAAGIAGDALVIYDADVTPELPGVVAWAQTSQVLAVSAKPVAGAAQMKNATIIECHPQGAEMDDSALASLELEPGQAVLSHVKDGSGVLTICDSRGGRSAKAIVLTAGSD